MKRTAPRDPQGHPMGSIMDMDVWHGIPTAAFPQYANSIGRAIITPHRMLDGRQMLLSWAPILTLVSVCSARRGPHHPRGQSPTDEQHHHYRPQGHDKITHDTKLIHDRRHLEEDLGHLASKQLVDMSDDELDFYYFTVHDFDRNSLLDGLEILKAVIHITEHDDSNHDEADTDTIGNHLDDSIDIEHIVDLVDQLLLEDDSNMDGYISYSEYKLSMKSGRALKNLKPSNDSLVGKS